MTTTELIQPPQATPRSVGPQAEPTAQTGREMLAEALALFEAPPAYGPAGVLLAIPWLLFVLVLAGPFAVLFTFALVLAAAAAVVALIVAILAAPLLLVRRLRSAWAARTPRREPAPALVSCLDAA